MELKISKLTKQFGDFTAVDCLKTTFMRIICTLLQPTSGQILCNGKDIFQMGADYRKLLGYLPQEFGFYPEFTVKDYLLYIAALKGIRPAVAKKRVKNLIAKVGLSKAENQKMKKLSGGMKRRAGIAQAMLNDPQILILDEPTRGIDVGAKAEIYKLINELTAQGMAIVLISSELPEVMGMSDRLLIMYEGRVTGQLLKEEYTEERVMEYATGRKVHNE